MKYTKKYATESAYDAEKSSLIKPNVSYIEENGGSVKYNPLNISGKVAKAGDIVLSDDNGKKLFVPKDVWDKTKYGDYTPIGVVVVPFTHTPDNTVRIMSLKNMSILTPASGSVATEGTTADTSMHWGGCEVTGETPNTGYTYQDCGLPKFNRIPIIDKNNQLDGTVGSTDWGRIPSNYIDGSTFSGGVASQIDLGTKYYVDNEDGRYSVSPYAEFDSRSYKAFKAITTSTNTLLDFNGASNTAKILTFQEGNTPSAAYSKKMFAPALTCNLYGTKGITAGEWYLPAEGELAYLVARYANINDTLTQLMTDYPTEAIRLWRNDSQVQDTSASVYGSWLWSSTEFSAAHARYVYVSNGYVNYNTKNYVSTANRVRAFAALSI